MDLSIFDEIMNDGFEQIMPHAAWPDMWTPISNDDWVVFDGDTDLIQDLEELKNDDLVIKQKKPKKKNEERKLSLEEVSQYFDMPNQAAAQELDMCLTTLKGHCRELGFRRWPYKKIKSLQNTIKNIQEGGNEGSLEEVLEVQYLEKEIESIKRNPNKELTKRFKNIRQKIYKDNYRKKKLELIDSI